MRIQYLSQGVPAEALGTPLVLTIGQGGVATAVELNLGSSEEVPDAIGDDGEFSASVIFNGEEIGFGIRNIDDSAQLTLRWLGANSLSISASHKDQEPKCEAYCASGRSGRPCVECDEGSFKVRVCC